MKRLLTLMSTVGLLSVMFAVPSTASASVAPNAVSVTNRADAARAKADTPKVKADSPQADAPEADHPRADAPQADLPQADAPQADHPQIDKVWVCKVVGGPGDYRLSAGNIPIHVDVNALHGSYPGIGQSFSDAQPSFVVASDSRALCEAGLPPVAQHTSATAPIFSAGTCLSPGSVVATGTIVYSWMIAGPDSAKVYTAVAKTGYTLTGRTSWTFDLRQLNGAACGAVHQAAVTKPSFTPGTCLAVGSVMTSETTNYSWVIAGPDSAKVYTAVAKTGYTLTGRTSWTFDLRQIASASGDQEGACDVPSVVDEPGLDEPGLDEPALDEPALDEPGLDGEPVEVLGTSASAPLPAHAVPDAALPILALTGVAGVVPMGIFGLIALALGAGLTAAARRGARG